jgi:divalent metal cation (Fe/Co/Zn/Cd) transporter
LVGGKGNSKKAVYAALFGNLGIAISKLIASILTGSTSMWAETYHSFSDTINQILLLIGIRTSKKKVSERHPFGHGKE